MPDKKNVLVLGAGLVARPLLRYMLTHYQHRVLVATLDVPRGQALMGEHPRGTVIQHDVTDVKATSKLVAEADIVVSLLPADLNPVVAKLAIAHKKSMVNTSYAAPEMWALDDAAKKAGVLLLNETGLDPGIDHMSATAKVEEINSGGGRITNFMSCCGGFPALDANTNPWGYKFSWTPRGVVRAGLQAARFLKDDGVVEVAGGGHIFDHSWPFELPGLGVFEIYPNRDSLKYVAPYELEGVSGMFRGTLRYPGWCATMKAVRDLGLLDTEVQEWPEGTTYRDVAARRVPGKGRNLSERIGAKLGLDLDSEEIARLEWMGLFSDRRIPHRKASAMDIFADRMRSLMMYKPGERDMVVMVHLMTVAYPDGSHEEVRSSLVLTGDPWGDTAMARTVSLPAAMAARLILKKAITARGVRMPVYREIYEPVLKELAEHGISLQDTRTKTFRGPFHE